MLKLIDANSDYLDQYKETYLLSLKQIELRNIKKHIIINQFKKETKSLF